MRYATPRSSTEPDCPRVTPSLGVMRKARRLLAVAGALGVASGAAACGSSSGGGSAAGTSVTAKGQVPASAKQTIVWAIQGGTGGGLGSEGAQNAYEIKTFERAHPNITVKVQTLSGTSSDQAQTQLTNNFTAGDSTPDVLDTGATWGATFGAAHWIEPLTQFHPRASQFFPGALHAGSYKGTVYMIPWYTNAEGVYYRKDLVKTPPTTPAKLVADAKAAVAADPSLKEGVAFEGDKYEGAVTVFVDLISAFGGRLDPQHLDTPANLAALKYLQQMVYRDKVAPQAVTGWQETQVQDAYQGKQAAFALNWPYVLEGLTPALRKHTGYIPFPSTSGNGGYATDGTEYLSMNAKSKHLAADWQLIKWLTKPANQIHRAIAAGDPPSSVAAYTPALYKGAPYMRTVKKLFSHLVPRPVTPEYGSISTDLQSMISEVLSNQQTPAKALKSTADQVSQLPQASS